MDKKAQHNPRNEDRKDKKKNWYMVFSAGANRDGIDPKASQIIAAAKSLDLDTYRFQMQGTVFLYVHCIQSEADNLMNTLGSEEYVFRILDAQAVRLLKIGKPQMIYKSGNKNSRDQQKPKKEDNKPKTLDETLRTSIN